MYKLTDIVEILSGVGPKTAQNLHDAGFKTIEDLVWHIPYRYEDQSKKGRVVDLIANEKFAVTVEIKDIKKIFTRQRKQFIKATAFDDTGTLEIFWFNQPYVTSYIKKGGIYTFFGQISDKSKKPTFTNPTYVSGSQQDGQNNIMPIYSQVQGFNTKWFRSKIKSIIENLDVQEQLPGELIEKYNLIPIKDALLLSHFPESMEDIEKAKHTLAFHEVFFLHLKGLYLKLNWSKPETSAQISRDRKKIDEFIAGLPFALTNSQMDVIEEILNDLIEEKPMNRLLQGDVGSGKTMVALVAALKILVEGHNVLYLAPTQILANQHHSTFSKFLDHFNIDVHLLTTSTKSLELKDNKPHITIGTHAIIHQLDKFSNIGLVIIDEQHKFGVKQRTVIRDHFIEGDKVPNLLTMTATPIPRSVALSIYGDLDLSIITEYPSNRKEVKTYVINESKRKSSYEWIKKEIDKEKLQVVFVCPFIEQSEAENLQQVKAAEVQYKEIEDAFWEYKVGLLHGRMKNDEKDKMIQDFSDHKMDILVTTPVIEVGVDIPNANIIFIETAERFGLASLHQLRGRVGRGEKQGYCILMSGNQESTSQRLKYMETVHSGHRLAEIDLQIRGPGNIYGIEQSGILNLKVADYSNLDLLKQTKFEAELVLSDENFQTKYIRDFLNDIDLVNND